MFGLSVGQRSRAFRPRGDGGLLSGWFWVLLLFLPACSFFFQRHPWQPPEVSLDDVAVAGVRWSRQDLDVILALANPNPQPMPVERLRLDLTIEGTALTEIDFRTAVVIPAGERLPVESRVRVDLLRCAEKLLPLLKQRRQGLTWRLKGTAELSDGSELEVDQGGSLPVR
ncbi:MAG: LEA type 2 family protein [Magnetococcales bacterium]|nr:LEA type 2 family protein [Magnetococcales bacterium]